MQRFGPSRGEWRFRLAVSLAGLGLLAGLLAVQGLPEGPGLVEVAGVAGLFFGLSAARALRALRPAARSEAPANAPSDHGAQDLDLVPRADRGEET